jgi:hypothetical protein
MLTEQSAFMTDRVAVSHREARDEQKNLLSLATVAT